MGHKFSNLVTKIIVFCALISLCLAVPQPRGKSVVEAEKSKSHTLMPWLTTNNHNDKDVPKNQCQATRDSCRQIPNVDQHMCSSEFARCVADVANGITTLSGSFTPTKTFLPTSGSVSVTPTPRPTIETSSLTGDGDVMEFQKKLDLFEQSCLPDFGALRAVMKRGAPSDLSDLKDRVNDIGTVGKVAAGAAKIFAEQAQHYYMLNKIDIKQAVKGFKAEGWWASAVQDVMLEGVNNGNKAYAYGQKIKDMLRTETGIFSSECQNLGKSIQEELEAESMESELSDNPDPGLSETIGLSQPEGDAYGPSGPSSQPGEIPEDTTSSQPPPIEEPSPGGQDVKIEDPSVAGNQDKSGSANDETTTESDTNDPSQGPAQDGMDAEDIEELDLYDPQASVTQPKQFPGVDLVKIKTAMESLKQAGALNLPIARQFIDSGFQIPPKASMVLQRNFGVDVHFGNIIGDVSDVAAIFTAKAAVSYFAALPTLYAGTGLVPKEPLTAEIAEIAASPQVLEAAGIPLTADQLAKAGNQLSRPLLKSTGKGTTIQIGFFNILYTIVSQISGLANPGKTGTIVKMLDQVGNKGITALDMVQASSDAVQAVGVAGSVELKLATDLRSAFYLGLTLSVPATGAGLLGHFVPMAVRKKRAVVIKKHGVDVVRSHVEKHRREVLSKTKHSTSTTTKTHVATKTDSSPSKTTKSPKTKPTKSSKTTSSNTTLPNTASTKTATSASKTKTTKSPKSTSAKTTSTWDTIVPTTLATFYTSSRTRPLTVPTTMPPLSPSSSTRLNHTLDSIRNDTNLEWNITRLADSTKSIIVQLPLPTKISNDTTTNKSRPLWIVPDTPVVNITSWDPESNMTTESTSTPAVNTTFANGPSINGTTKSSTRFQGTALDIPIVNITAWYPKPNLTMESTGMPIINKTLTSIDLANNTVLPTAETLSLPISPIMPSNKTVPVDIPNPIGNDETYPPLLSSANRTLEELLKKALPSNGMWINGTVLNVTRLLQESLKNIKTSLLDSEATQHLSGDTLQQVWNWIQKVEEGTADASLSDLWEDLFGAGRLE